MCYNPDKIVAILLLGDFSRSCVLSTLAARKARAAVLGRTCCDGGTIKGFSSV